MLQGPPPCLMLSTGSTCFEDHKPSLFVLRHAGLGSSVLILQMRGKKMPPASLRGGCSAPLRVVEAAQRSRPLHLRVREDDPTHPARPLHSGKRSWSMNGRNNTGAERIGLQMSKFVQSLNYLTTAFHSRSRSSSLVRVGGHIKTFSGGQSNSHR